MSKTRRTTGILALAGILASLVTFVSSGTAVAAETMPELQWPATASSAYTYHQTTTSPQGDVTVGCRNIGNPDQNLITYGPTGAITRQLDRTVPVDGTWKNCIMRPVVDKVGDLYGKVDGGSTLFAYNGNVVKWTYSTGCSKGEPTVGADGNIYFVDSQQHLIGIAPNLASGQTTPTKVLDVVVGSSCSQGNLLFAYKDGIAVEWSYGTKLKYVSYGGKMLGDLPTSVGYIQGQAKINADGVVFATKVISGSPNSYQVTAYNPATASVSWSTTVSTPGINGLGIYNLYPTAGGGVAAMVRERKSQGGVEVIPLEWVYRLVILNVNGQVVNSTTLPNVDASGNAYGNYSVATDTTGKLAIVRAKMIQLTSSPWQSEANEIAVMGLPSLNVVYSAEIRGNIDKTQGQVYGYRVEDQSGTFPISPNTLYLNTRKCGDSNCYGYDLTLRAVKVQGLGMDYPRGAVTNPSPRPASPYVALGDSFSSGEGVPPFESGTDTTGVNTCHRSTTPYARQIAGTSAKIPAIGSGGFRACSGAVTDNVWDVPQANEGIQIDRYPDPTIQLVTISIGGNDMGFSDFATQCVISTCDVGSAAYNTALNKITNEIPGKLETTYKKLLQYAPNAKIYVVGYPQVIADKSVSAPDDIRCVYMQDGVTKWGDARAARDIVQKLNEKISQKIFELRALSTDNTRLRFVFMNDPATSPFVGHEICGVSTTSFFQNVDQINPDRRYIFHPNQLGQNAYATIVGGTINASS
ncbi:SGNH/GDSL hydrolase family protein [Kribbella sp. NPDC058693]|uniref:SGNH/GDSL hydrolase family protein n=1 Tax=Kribbella sp. NPDC058693 TaxID=3346602 RepID=UPI0036661B2F